MNGIGGSAMKLVFSVILVLVVGACVPAPSEVRETAPEIVTLELEEEIDDIEDDSAALPATIQPNVVREGRIGKIDIEGLTPLEVSFEFHNIGQTPMGVYGKAILSDYLGNQVEEIAIKPFGVQSGQVAQVKLSSRWGFQKPGIYLLQITLEIDLDALVSKSLAFRIAPISLPLSPSQNLEGEELYTIPQKPVNWGITRIQAPLAWQTTHGADNIIVAVIDSGVDSNIPELDRSMWVNQDEIPDNGVDDDENGYIDDIHGWDFQDNDNSSLSGTSLHWHGTFVASIIAAWPTEGGIVGVAPGVKIMDIRILDSEGRFKQRNWKPFINAIDYAVDNGARIINLSIYADGKMPSSFKKAIQRAYKNGVIIVGITGNDGKSQVYYPGKYNYVIAVSATNFNDQLASFSNYGDEVAVTAPGYLITSLTHGGSPATMSGTSYAGPHVSGILALILSVNPQLTAAEALALLEKSVADLGEQGHDRQFGYGLIDAYRSVTRTSQ